RRAPRAGGGALAGAADAKTRTPAVEGAVPARQLADVQPEVPTQLAATIRRLRTAARPAARRHRGARRRGVPAVHRPEAVTASVGVGLVLSLASAVALNWGYFAQHDAATSLPRLTLRRPLRSLALLFKNRRWLAGFLVGIGGWVLYVAALALAPLSLVQATAAGGIGILALLAWQATGVRPARREIAAVAAAVTGLALLGASLAGQHGKGSQPAWQAVALWMVCSGAVAAAAAGFGGRGGLAPGAGLGAAAGVLYAAGDVGTKAAVGGGGRLAFVPVLLACHGLAFVALQLGFQR